MSLLFKKALLPKFPSWPQWKQILRVLNKREKTALVILLILFLASSFFLGFSFYLKNTKELPSRGGIYREGVIGRPRFINPIYGGLSDVDRDLIQIIFSGLMKYDDAGKIAPDLAKECKILESGKIVECYLKEDVSWQDGEKLTADDVIFTIETIQNSDYTSPLIAAWVGVEVEKISDLGIRFKLRNPYSGFLENLTLKILPRHIWQDIPSQSFPLSPYNLQPVGSGPYQLKEIKQNKSGYIESLTLAASPKYYGKQPNIPEVSFYFFDTEEELIKAARKKEIQGLSIISVKNYPALKESGFNDYRLSLPRYFALFFNPEKSKIFAEEKVRQALNYGTNKGEIIQKVLLGHAEIVNSPILPEIYNFSPPSSWYEFNAEKAKATLEEAGFFINAEGIREKTTKEGASFKWKSELKVGSQGQEVKELQKCLSNPPAGGPEIYPEAKVTGFFDQATKTAVIKFQEKYSQEILEPGSLKEGTGVVSKNTRNKLNELCGKISKETLLLSFTLSTVDQPIMGEVAERLKEQWEALGIKVEIKIFDIQTLERDVIKPRNYDVLLFGEVLGAIPDPFPYWHSSQKKDPGLNLALYEDKKADKLLEESRKTLDPEIRSKNLAEFQNILISSAPAVFLYNPDYIYLVSKKVKGINVGMIADPSKRFVNIEDWYFKTKRAWK